MKCLVQRPVKYLEVGEQAAWQERLVLCLVWGQQRVWELFWGQLGNQFDDQVVVLELVWARLLDLMVEPMVDRFECPRPASVLA